MMYEVGAHAKRMGFQKAAFASAKLLLGVV
jgi:hypothetical protein